MIIIFNWRKKTKIFCRKASVRDWIEVTKKTAEYVGNHTDNYQMHNYLDRMADNWKQIVFIHNRLHNEELHSK